MAQQVNLNTVTTVTRANSNVSIFTKYEPLDEFVEIELYEDAEIFDNVRFIEGELRVTKDGYEDITFEVDSQGVGIVFGSSRVTEFVINDQGELIHNMP